MWLTERNGQGPRAELRSESMKDRSCWENVTDVGLFKVYSRGSRANVANGSGPLTPAIYINQTSVMRGNKDHKEQRNLLTEVQQCIRLVDCLYLGLEVKKLCGDGSMWQRVMDPCTCQGMTRASDHVSSHLTTSESRSLYFPERCTEHVGDRGAEEATAGEARVYESSKQDRHLLLGGDPPTGSANMVQDDRDL